jgi:outer membrane protein TolC
MIFSSASGLRAYPRSTVIGLAFLCLTVNLAGAPQAPAQAQETAPAQVSSNLPPLPASPTEAAEKDGTALRMSMKDLTKLALQNNLNIAISDTNEELYGLRIRQAFGPYDPVLALTVGAQNNRSPNTNRSTAALAPYNEVGSARWNLSYQQSVRTGGTISAFLNSNRAQTNQQFALFSPQYNTNTMVQFSQPLLRNFRIDQNRGTIKLANLDLKLNDSTFKQNVVDTIARIQSLYWDLVGVIRDYDIKRESVRLAQISLRDNRKKVEIGTLAPISITEAQAELASREVDLIVAEERIINVENSMRNLISNDRTADIWQQVIVPTDAPEFKEYKVELQQAIDTALSNRPELEQLSLKMQQNDVSYAMYKDRSKWQVDLVGQVGSVGVSGPQTEVGGIPTIPPDLVGGPWHSYNVLFTQGFVNWFAGFNIQIPLRNTALDSQLAQVKVQNRQMMMNRRVTEQQIQTDIRNAVQAIETNKKRVDTARIARELAQEQLTGEEKRFQAGLSENFRVLDRQRGLSQAQGVELQSLIAYQQSIITLQRTMYTLLEANDFEIAKTSSQSVASVK